MRVLLLGGTAEARTLASELVQRGVDVISSLAGRVSNPALPVGDVRVGGFGGVAGLTRFLAEEAITAVVDATHPFAATITGNAVAAARMPIVVLRRPGWKAGPGDDWRRVADITAAAEHAAAFGPGAIFLTTGRRDLAAFAGDSTHEYLVRTVDPPTAPTPPRTTLVLARGPYVAESERALMLEHDVRLLVTKDSGGDLTSAKLAAARDLRLPVVMVERPAVPGGVPVLSSVPDVLTWLAQLPG